MLLFSWFRQILSVRTRQAFAVQKKVHGARLNHVTVRIFPLYETRPLVLVWQITWMRAAEKQACSPHEWKKALTISCRGRRWSALKGDNVGATSGDGCGYDPSWKIWQRRARCPLGDLFDLIGLIVSILICYWLVVTCVSRWCGRIDPKPIQSDF